MKPPQINGYCLLVVFSAFTLLCYGCANPTLKKHPQGDVRQRITEVPFYPEDSNRCGPAALAGVMNYWRNDNDFTPATIAKRITSDSAGGTLMADMAWYARSRGFVASIEQGVIAELQDSIDDKQPAVVFVRRKSMTGHHDHFLTITGYTSRGFIVNSGTRSGQFITYRRFQVLWNANGNHVLYVTPEG